jgi:hypothetical protein
MTGNASTGDLERTGTRKAVPSGPAKKAAAAAKRAARLAKISRNYSLQVIVTDPAGNEILNLTKLTLKRDLHHRGNAIPDIQDVIALLIDAAQEHVLPFD